ncbi:Nuclear receptor subfamily 2 group C member 2 [Acipenser ruthenus]|uniref:Nuclear receptor subfamily 2 group C member 2 n=1 Tax=Acipenser ruthenus TaxID=7906 RepID=A0A444V3B8_ACIRT|nr:Nuclear receptor subfamily 2 group C member 2 [Acipenser ruthenus]
MSCMHGDVHTHPTARINNTIGRHTANIVTDQQTGQKIQIVTAVDSSASRQQFILTTPDGSGAGKVILAAPDSANTKQLIFTTAENIVPGRIQIVTDAASVERLLGKADVGRAQPVEYCVVCGDKASGKLYSNCIFAYNMYSIPRRSSLLDPGMLVNIQQPLMQTDGTLLLATDLKAESNQGDLGTLANVVSSLANLNESLNNGDTSEMQQEDQSATEITRAFDTLAKALNPTDSNAGQSLAEGADTAGGASIQVISRDQSTPIIEVEGPLLTDTHVSFKLTMPTPMPEYLNVHYICESASRLLFLSMHWARSIPAFQALGQDCNTSLVRACWNELFTLGLAQCAQVMSLSTILAAIINHLQNSIQDEKLSGDRIKLVMEHIWKLQEFCNSMAKFEIDRYEYAYLKAIVLFSPDHPGLNSTSQIEQFQEKAQMELQDYVQKTYPDDTYRLARILMRLPALRLMSSSITEELFFTGLIGNVPIDSIIPYILKMETAEYNSQITGTSA